MDEDHHNILARIAEALERLAPAAGNMPQWDGAEAFQWEARTARLAPVPKVARVQLSLLKGINQQRDLLVANTERFARGLPANNALLWGARGTGKSALIKATHAHVRSSCKLDLKLIEIHKEDINSLGILLSTLSEAPVRVILFCDDLSFDASDNAYRALKTVLEGGIAGRPANVIFYATSNRRHLMPRDMIDNERSTAIHPDEAIEVRPRCRTASVCGLAFTTSARWTTSTSWPVTPPTTRSKSIGRSWSVAHWNGPSHEARAQVAWPGNSSRIWQANWVSDLPWPSSDSPADQRAFRRVEFRNEAARGRHCR